MVRKIVVKTFIAAVLILLYLPIVWMIVFSFTGTTSFSSWGGFTFDNYINLFTGNGANADKIQEALLNTLFVGFFVSLLSTVLGTLGAIGLHAIHSKKIKTAYSTVNQIPMINSEIVTAIALALVFNLFSATFKISDGSWGATAFKLILAQTSFCAPYVLLNVLPRLQKSDNKIYEAALDLGCTPAKALFKVVLPDILPGIVVGALLSFTLSIDDFVITKVNVTSFETLSTLLYGLKNGKHPLPADIRALFTIIFFIVFALMMILYSPRKKSAKD
ncbi:MAG: ABC transporter permease [Clostridia bacterium]|nr:ABC transporter permease [Clostridia bacterium]MDE7328237.1 ABC transporter permease [Clostridia bacterium]